MQISIRRLDVQQEALAHTLRAHLFRGEHVREWVFGRAGRSQARYIVLTNRRVLSLLGDAGAVRLEWAALHVTVTSASLRRLVTRSELVVRRGDHETRVHVQPPFRKQARALAAAL